MVRDDDVDAAIDRAPHRVHAGDSAVNGDHEAHGLLSHNALQHFEFQAVAVNEAMGNDVIGIGADQPQNRLQQNDRSDAIDIVIAIDQDRFAIAHRPLDSLASRADPVNSGRIVQIRQRWCDEAAVIVGARDAAVREDGAQDGVDWQPDIRRIVGKNPFVVNQCSALFEHSHLTELRESFFKE